MRDNRLEQFNNLKKVVKRIGLAILVCIPICILFGYFTRNIIKSDTLQIVCFMAIMGLGVLAVEVVARAKEKRQKEDKSLGKKEDVFK